MNITKENIKEFVDDYHSAEESGDWYNFRTMYGEDKDYLGMLINFIEDKLL